MRCSNTSGSIEMTIFTRIAGTEPDRADQSTKISPHLLTAVIGLFGSGTITGPEGLAAFDPVLDAEEVAQATDIFDAILAATYTRDFACDIFYLTELGTDPYTTEARFNSDLAIT